MTVTEKKILVQYVNFLPNTTFVVRYPTQVSGPKTRTDTGPNNYQHWGVTLRLIPSL